MARYRLLVASLLVSSCFTAAAEQGPGFPAKPVTLVAPSSPGSAPDVLARLLAQKLSQAWNTAVVVVNRPGAGGEIGSEVVARAAPDGYTILLGSIANTVNPHILARAKNEARALMPVAMIATSPDILLVHPSDKAARSSTKPRLNTRSAYLVSTRQRRGCPLGRNPSSISRIWSQAALSQSSCAFH